MWDSWHATLPVKNSPCQKSPNEEDADFFRLNGLIKYRDPKPGQV